MVSVEDIETVLKDETATGRDVIDQLAASVSPRSFNSRKEFDPQTHQKMAVTSERTARLSTLLRELLNLRKKKDPPITADEDRLVAQVATAIRSELRFQIFLDCKRAGKTLLEGEEVDILKGGVLGKRK